MRLIEIVAAVHDQQYVHVCCFDGAPLCQHSSHIASVSARMVNHAEALCNQILVDIRLEGIRGRTTNDGDNRGGCETTSYWSTWQTKFSACGRTLRHKIMSPLPGFGRSRSCHIIHQLTKDLLLCRTVQTLKLQVLAADMFSKRARIAVPSVTWMLCD